MTATRHAALGLDAPTLEPDDQLVYRLAALAAASQAAPPRRGAPSWRVALATAGLVGVSVGGAWAAGTISVPGLPEPGRAPRDTVPAAPQTPEEPATPRSGSSGSSSFSPAPAPTPQTPGPADDATVSPDDKALESAGPGPGGWHGQGQGRPPNDHPGQARPPAEHPGQGQSKGQRQGQERGHGPGQGQDDRRVEGRSD